MEGVARGATCSECGAQFPSRNKLFSHLRLHRSSSSAAPASAPGETLRQIQEGVSVAPAHTASIELLFQDSCVAAFIKPQGINTTGGHGSLLRSDALLLSAEDCSKSDVRKAAPVHRLDKCTGGIVLCSKSKTSDKFLKKQFRLRKVHKRYIAIVSGLLDKSTTIVDLPLNGQECRTDVQVLQHTRSAQYGWITTVNLFPVTGRKHQLRRHMLLIGHHIIGDQRYSSRLDLPYDSYNTSDGTPELESEVMTSGLLYLWAMEISFPHPELQDDNGQPATMTLSIPEEPAIFRNFRSFEEEKYKLVG